MTQAARKLNIDEYLALDAEDWVSLGLPEGRCEYVDGELVELPPESDHNDRIALNLRDHLLGLGSNDWLIRVHSCEVAVPKLHPKDPLTRFPDLVVLHEAHLPLIQRRLAIPLNTVPPKLVAEVVSPGIENEERDYERKRAQYAVRGIPEYWLLEPHYQRIRVLELRGNKYEEVATLRNSDRLVSKVFPALRLTTQQVLNFVTSRLKQEIERAEAERQRAEQAEAQLETERQRAEQAETQLEAERQRAETQLEAERQRAKQAEQRAELLAKRLREMGINIDES